MAKLALKRVYDAPAASDGYRVLVDRVWPRGVSKDRAKLDRWLKDIGPSRELRQWFGHRPAKFDEFARRYQAELAGNPALGELQSLAAQHHTVTLLYGAKDLEHNQAVVLRRYLAKH